MSILDEIRSNGAESEVRNALQTAVRAERNNENLKNSGENKNTHFELRFGDSEDEEVFVYVERLEHDSGVEVMVWADESYFQNVVAERPMVSDGSHDFEEFVGILFEYVTDELDTGKSNARPSFHTNAPPSVVFSDQFYL